MIVKQNQAGIRTDESRAIYQFVCYGEGCTQMSVRMYG